MQNMFLAVLCTAFLTVAELKNPVDFLKQYGYLDEKDNAAISLEISIRSMQRFANLPETGVLDQATLKVMTLPRCGVRDYELHGYSRTRKWSSLDLTYRFENYTPDLTQNETKGIMREAFQVWANVTPLRFKEVKNGGDFNIVFGSYHHPGAWGKSGKGRCNARFDGAGGVLAHAYFPPDGRTHFDESEKFTDKTRSGTNLFWVAAHEFGHALGLPHSNVRGALMYPYYTGYRENFILHVDDINRMVKLYGSSLPPGITRPPMTQPPTTTTQTWPPGCVDKNGETFCKARISVCTTTNQAWYDFMKRNCYRTCFCSGPITPPSTTTSQATVKITQATTTTEAPTTVVPTTTSTTSKPTGPACVDKAGRYCNNHVQRCATNDPVWKSYLIRNCFKTCFC